MDDKSGVIFIPRVRWRETLKVSLVFYSLFLFLGLFLGDGYKEIYPIFLAGVFILATPLIKILTRESMTIKICPRGITWGSKYVKEHFVSWNRILGVHLVKRYKPTEAIGLRIEGKKLIPTYGVAILLPTDRMHDFIDAVMTYAPFENPLRAYIKAQFIDSAVMPVTKD